MSRRISRGKRAHLLAQLDVRVKLQEARARQCALEAELRSLRRLNRSGAFVLPAGAEVRMLSMDQLVRKAVFSRDTMRDRSPVTEPLPPGRWHLYLPRPKTIDAHDVELRAGTINRAPELIPGRAEGEPLEVFKRRIRGPLTMADIARENTFYRLDRESKP